MSIPQQAVQYLGISCALYYAYYKMAVFPVYFVYDDGTCSCENPACGRNTGKHPMTDHGFKDASVDEGMIRHWWEGEPDANIGVRTGEESGIVVIDVDPRHGGDVAFEALLAQHGPLPVTPRVRTGGGGWHIYFAHPGGGLRVGNRQDMVPGVDVRGDGGYVLGAGSNHVLGDYLLESGLGLHDVPLAPMPLWLLDLILGNEAEPLPVPVPPTPTSPTQGGEQLAVLPEGALGKGQRHPTLFAMAGAMRQKGMSRAGIEAALRAENQARCSPPLEEKDIQKMLAGVLKYPAGGVPKGRFLSVPPREDVVQETIQAFETAADPKVTAHEVKWVVRGYVAEGSITLLTGRAKASGKSTLTTAMVARILDGHHFLGMGTQKSPVVYLTEERDTFTELLKRSGVLGRPDFRFLRYDPARDATFAEQVLAAKRLAKEIGAKVLVVDTIAQFLALRGDTENEAGAALEALKPLQEAARDGLAVIALHHEKKGGGDVGEAGRGSSAFAGAVDIILSLRRPEGQTSPKVRVINSLSRYDCTPDTLFIELTENGYERREEAAVISSAVEKTLLEGAPTEETSAVPVVQLIDPTKVKESTARKVATKLVDEGKLKRKGGGKKGDPHLYWRDGADSFRTTPPPTGTETNPAPPPVPGSV